MPDATGDHAGRSRLWAVRCASLRIFRRGLGWAAYEQRGPLVDASRVNVLLSRNAIFVGITISPNCLANPGNSICNAASIAPRELSDDLLAAGAYLSLAPA